MTHRSMAWRFGLLGLFLVFVSILSEVVYLWKNDEFSKIVIYPRILLAKRMIRRGNWVDGWRQVVRAADFHERYILLTRYSFLPQEITVIPAEVEDEKKFMDLFYNLMQITSANLMIKTEEANLSLLHYRLGLGMGEASPTSEWLLRKAVALAPELSFYHVELANYYLLNDRLEEAKKALEFCVLFDFPANHCRDFMENVELNEPSSFGFMSDHVEEYYAGFIRVQRQ